jgi:catechol 2,3-dioxygenase-like lactoylglutathione lyase family enzyme
MAVERSIEKMFHFAFPCRDAEETRAFYEEVIGLPMTSAVKVAAVPSTGEAGPYLHIFFELGDGSYLAFFDLGNGEAAKPSPNTPRWVQHFAMEVPSVDHVKQMKARLEKAGVEVLGVVDHEFIQSIYFFDPNGLRLEVTTRTEPEGFVEEQRRSAHQALRDWQTLKAERKSAAMA